MMYAELLDEPQPSEVLPQTPRVLLIDDDQGLAEVLSQRLRQQGFEVSHAETGRDGLARAIAYPPSLILLDLRLPDADGLAICAQLADAPETCAVPVIILSGMELPDIIRRTRAAGCAYFIRKPYDPNALLLLIRQALSDAAE